MLPKIVKKTLKHIYKQAPINNYMDSIQNVWHTVWHSEYSFTRFAIFTYGNDSCDFDTWDDLVEWAHNQYHYSRSRLPEWDCSGLTVMYDYRVVELHKMDSICEAKYGGVCAVIFKYLLDV